MFIHNQKIRDKKSDSPKTTPQKSDQDMYRYEIKTFLLRLGSFVLLLFFIFRFLFGIFMMPDDSMYPVLGAGDLVFYFRPENEFSAGDVVVCESDSETWCGRIAAKEGDSVTVTEEGTLYINDSLVNEDAIFYETVRYDSDVSYPLVLRQNEYFILCDHRTNGKDSRYFGAVHSSEIKGRLFAALRREGV